MSIAIEDVIDTQALAEEQDEPQAARPVEPPVVAASSFAGASPAIPRDPRLLKAEQAEHEARTAAEDAVAAKVAAEEAATRAAAAKAAADRSKAELEAARAEAIAKAEAAALQVRFEREELDNKAAVHAHNRARRDERLGTVRTVAASDADVVTVTRHTSDAPAGSLALFLVRLVLGGWLGIVGWQALVDRPAVVDAMVKVGVPYATSTSLAWGVGIGLIFSAVFLLVGVATRAVAVVTLAGVGVFLAYFRFGPFSPFMEGHFGFFGDRDVLLAVLCLVLILVGAGGFSMDARIRRRRQVAKQAG